jgi:lipopolysaccharide export system protein LptA
MNRHRILVRVVLCAMLFAGLSAAVTARASAQAASDLFAGFQTKSKDPVQVDAGALEISEQGKQRVSVFSGNVVVKRGKTTLKAGTIKLYSDLDAAATADAFSRIEAGGKVWVSSGEQTVTGDSAVVDMKARTIVVSGGVVLSQGNNVITGSRLVVNLATGSARVEQEPGKQIRGVFSPDSGGIAPPGQ